VIVACPVRRPHPTPHKKKQKNRTKKTGTKPHANEQKFTQKNCSHEATTAHHDPLLSMAMVVCSDDTETMPPYPPDPAK
jgi:hypothetical protein